MATRRPCTSPCPPPIWAPILANEFCRIFSIPRFIFACTLSGAIASGYMGPGPEGLGPEFFSGSKQDAWIGIWIVIRAERGHCGHILVLAVVNWVVDVYSDSRRRPRRYTSEISPRKTKNAGIDHCRPSTKKVITDIPRSNAMFTIVKKGWPGRRIGKLRSRSRVIALRNRR